KHSYAKRPSHSVPRTTGPGCSRGSDFAEDIDGNAPILSGSAVRAVFGNGAPESAATPLARRPSSTASGLGLSGRSEDLRRFQIADFRLQISRILQVPIAAARQPHAQRAD